MKCRVQVKELQNPETVFDRIIGLVIRLAEHGLIHCDFNEFNIMVLLSSEHSGFPPQPHHPLPPPTNLSITMNSYSAYILKNTRTNRQ